MSITHKYAFSTKLPLCTCSKVLRIFAACVFLSLFVAQAQAVVIINDSFSDGNSANQNLPSSARWYTGGPSTNVSVENGVMTFRDASANKGTAMAYFNAVDLQVGQSLSLSFNYSFAETSTEENSLMFGLYNSGGSYQTKDAVGFHNKIFETYTGYAASGVLGTDTSASGSDHIEARNAGEKNLLSLDTYTVGNSSVQSGAATPGETYTAWMQISRTAQGITVESKIGDSTFVQTYTSEMFTHFDTVGIFSNGDAGAFTLDNVKLDYSGAPEPSSVVAMTLLGLFVFGRAMTDRMKRTLMRSLA